MRQITKLAIIEHGEAAVRVATAATAPQLDDAPALATVMFATGAGPAPWFAREADDIVAVPLAGGEAVPSESRLPADAHIDPPAVVAALQRAGADAVWVGALSTAARIGIVRGCERAGVTVVGPSGDALDRIADPASLRSAAEAVGLAVDPQIRETDRVLEVDVLADAAGTVWALGARDVSVRVGDVAVLAEYPAAGLSAAQAASLDAAARQLARLLGVRGGATISFALDPSQKIRVVGVDPVARPEHALFAESTGLSHVGLRLHLARGGVLDAEAPRPDGHAVGVRLLAYDIESGLEPSGGIVELLSFPTGTGVRVDSSLRVGDLVDPLVEPVVATMSAHGRDRAEALHRVQRALERTHLVLRDGTTLRSALAAAVRQEELRTAPVPVGWFRGLLADGRVRAASDPVAVLAAAIEAYEADLDVVRATFLTSAARGRPSTPDVGGVRLQLFYRGHEYVVRVDRTGPRSYRVTTADASVVDVDADRLGRFEWRLACAGRRHRVVSQRAGARIRLDVDGGAHVVERRDGLAVRTERPALVGTVLVETGAQVQSGDPVATLESMKMVSTVSAPISGVVAEVAVLPGHQVDRGALLLRIRPETGREAEVSDGAQPPLDVTAYAMRTVDAPPDPTQVYAALHAYLLGYDLDPAGLHAVFDAARRLGRDHPHPAVARAQDRLLELFSDVGSLYRPRTVDDEMPDSGNTQEYFHSYLQWLDPDQAGLPDRYRSRLTAALSRYGVADLRRSPELEDAVVWMFRSFARVPQVSPVVADILQQRLRAHDGRTRTAASAEDARLLQRLAAATEGRQQTVADLARDLLFYDLDEPMLQAVAADVESRMDTALAALRADPGRADRADRVTDLVGCPQPLRPQLLHAWLAAGSDETAFRGALLEVHLRRFYRNRELGPLRWSEHGGHLVVTGDYEHHGRWVTVVAGYLAWDAIPELAEVVARVIDPLPDGREVIVEVVSWRDGEHRPIDETARELESMLQQARFGRRLTRLDLTVTALTGEQREAHRTVHVTFRQEPEGRFVEDRTYRNLHPMLAKRLEMWRLSNFEVERLPSPEDIYLFHGVARDNPRDRRLFVLAEVRDLTPGTDDAGEVTYPLLHRMGLMALAALRSALRRFPPRDRPVANRIVLWVRPTFTLPTEHWASVLGRFAPLARGAGLDRLVLHLHVRDSSQPGAPLVDKALYVEGTEQVGISIRMDDPGPDPIRPRTAYAQKVLTAARFQAPYPYEIIAMLTPSRGVQSPFPPGSFEELDLDDSGETLVPVDRAPGNNTAHLVVGVLTSYTDLVPDGMSRVALLSDPTRGLGNLAQPECRRVNAALRYAQERGLPVEWYAVSSGALIAMESGSENMDWIARTLRAIIEHTQAGGEINVVVTGINVGGQPYWNAESTMLMHTRGILVMTPASTMVLTGKQALDFSGAVSADDNFGIGGYDRVMGPNGQAQYWAPTFQDACQVLMQHYEYTYVVPGERFPRRRSSGDPTTRDVRAAPHAPVAGSSFTTVGDIFDPARNPERKQPFDMRSVMRAVTDADCEPLERWRHWQGSDTSIVWDARIGGVAVCLLGLESHTVPRTGFVPSYGPPAWTSGTLFPQSSRKTARAINAASGNRPLVVLANLSGFDGSPESMRSWQLEYGAEIGRAVTNFRGPIVFVVVSRYHGGAFVVFSGALNESMEIAALEGSYCSVIGGAPAAATVFVREVAQRTDQDPRLVRARQDAAAASGPEAAAMRARTAGLQEQVRTEKLREVAEEFDAIHTVERALRMRSIDHIISPEQLRPFVVEALLRGMQREADTARSPR